MLRAAPSVAFASFKAQLRDFKCNGVVSPISVSSLGAVPRAVGLQIIPALRFFSLIDSRNNPMPSLDELVDAVDANAWPKALEKVLRNSYQPIFVLNLETASRSNFERIFENYTSSQSGPRKMIRFFLQAATEAEIKINTRILHYRKAREPHTSRVEAIDNASFRSAAVDEENAGLHGSIVGHNPVLSDFQALVAKYPELDRSWEPELLSEWFKRFDRLMDIFERSNLPRSIDLEQATGTTKE